MPCACGKKASYRCRPDKTVLSSVGHITVGRRYYACRGCGAKQVSWDAWAGVAGTHRITPHARRMIVLAGSDGSFDRASERLKELCRLSVSDDVVRRVCDEQGRDVQQWMSSTPEAGKAFARAAGEAEFSTDGVKVNTVDGWREMRLSVMSKREPTTPAAPAQWDRRVLNEPTVRLAWCAIAPCGRIGASWERMAKLVGLSDDQPLSVLADGARWIWDQAARRFGPSAEWVVDIYHVLLYIHAAAAAMLGEGTEASRQWAEARVLELIELGGPGFIARLKELGPMADMPAAAAATKAWEKLLGYLTENRDSLWYRQRLERGQPIGSGLIEGGCKNTIGARLKLNGARWRVRRAERMGAIRCLQYSGQWQAYWESKAA